MCNRRLNWVKTTLKFSMPLSPKAHKCSTSENPTPAPRGGGGFDPPIHPLTPPQGRVSDTLSNSLAAVLSMSGNAIQGRESLGGGGTKGRHEGEGRGGIWI